MTKKNTFFEGKSWFELNNLGLALGMALSFYTSVTRRLKLRLREFWVYFQTPVEVRGGKLAGGTHLNRVKIVTATIINNWTTSNTIHKFLIIHYLLLFYICNVFICEIASNLFQKLVDISNTLFSSLCSFIGSFSLHIKIIPGLPSRSIFIW